MCPRTLSPAKRNESIPLTSAVPRSVGTASVCPKSLFDKLVDREASPRHGPDFAEILRIPVAKSAPVVAVHAAGHDWNLSGPRPLMRFRLLTKLNRIRLRLRFLICAHADCPVQSFLQDGMISSAAFLHIFTGLMPFRSLLLCQQSRHPKQIVCYWRIKHPSDFRQRSCLSQDPHQFDHRGLAGHRIRFQK